MGVQGLWKLLECSGRPINPETLEGKILAVDISIWLNQAVKGARDRHGDAIQNAHLLTLFHRLCKLLFFRIRPIFVFDGEAPLLKKQTLIKRRQKKDLAVNEAKKTNEKLLRTFLKRQAIKAALSGNKQSNEEFPSLSNIRRKEEEDIFALSPLEENEIHSSEEEEERKWEERMNHKQILQEEFLSNPNSVDVDSEEFNNLPPELKHEILTDMKEFTKRRRTLFETMPEGSDDFSQYQLKGLLKKNNLNRCLYNVRKEMTQQHTGEVCAQFETEGGFMREVESNRLVSEDTSHYILIKGIQSKSKDKKEEIPEQAVPSSSNEALPKTYLDFKLASAHKPKKAADAIPESNSSVHDTAPPSPRTLFAIQEAMLENSSDEEIHGNKVSENYQIPRESVCTLDGKVSPRTLQAIQQALAEDEVVVNKKRSVVNVEDEDQPRSKVLIISSSDEEDVAFISKEKVQMPPVISLEGKKLSPSPVQSDTGNSDEKSLINRSVLNLKQSEPFVKFNTSKAESLHFSSQLVERNLSHGESVKETLSLSVDSHAISVTMPSFVMEGQTLDASMNLENPILIPSKAAETSDIESRNQPDVPSVAHTIERPSHPPSDQVANIILPGTSGMTLISSTNMPTSPKLVAEASCPPSIALIEEDVLVSKVIDSSTQQPSSSNVLDITYVPMTPESIPVSEAESDREEDTESDSEDGFIEVEGDLDDENPQLVQTSESFREIVPVPTRTAPDHVDESQSTSSNVTSTVTENDRVGNQDAILQQSEEPGDRKKAINEWQDMNTEELELLENNLFVQQSSLQAEKQQQERVAASVTGQMCLESQELLRLFGIPFIVAPMEAEAQCAVLDLTDQTSGTVTDDSDIWLFGARHVYKNFFSQNKYVTYYQFSDIHNQLGLDRTKLINLAYLMGSDYTEGITSVGFVSAMEILNEFPGLGLEPLLKFKEWWMEAQKNKKIRPNPNDTKVKKKLRDLELHPNFPNRAVAEAYLKPVVDESKGAFFWGRPDLEQIREFCENRFGWYHSKTDEILLPVLKQLNAQQTQLRIDSFFCVERDDVHASKSQRLRRAITCIKRKEKDVETAEVEEATELLEREYALAEQKTIKSSRNSKKSQRDRNKTDYPVHVEGGFIGPATKALATDNEKSVTELDIDSEDRNVDTRNNRVQSASIDCSVSTQEKIEKVETSSSSDEEKLVLVTAKPVFRGSKKKLRAVRGQKR